MTVHQHAVEVRAFARYLRDLAALLDPGRGWYGIFCARDPAGMRACFEGSEVPPWDVVESLLQDLAAVRGAGQAAEESVRAAALFAASAAAYDGRPGGRQALADRLDMMLREQSDAVRRLGDADGEPDALAWARDDHARATARCVELRDRLAAVERTVPVTDPWFRGQDGADVPTVSAPRRGKPSGARFAGLDTGDEAEADPVPSPGPGLPAAAPRGARFRGAPAEVAPAPSAPEPDDPAAHRAAGDVVAQLVRLRAEGRSGEAHVVLCEAAAWPAGRLPVLAAALRGAGLEADRATLLWEMSSLTPAELAAAAGALAAAGLADDCGQLLRLGVARPAAEVADAVVALDRAGLEAEARALLEAFVRVRTPQEAARIAEGGPRHLVPRLLAAAREVSATRERDLVHALRVAGVAAP
ncbi:hypothetical protein [[Kitasatospora] papulosa]|uniref:hypothetical protein n=1 Tax=[Kitasatospora] papulosa TaxID=1464011 RepID=UPI0036C25CC2|nr:hypothetical protein [Streptomyces pratensis]